MSAPETNNNIVALRHAAFALDIPIIVVLIAGVLSAGVSKVLPPLFGVIAFALFYRKLLKAAHAPCPRCKNPFGTNARWPLGVGTEQCQHCGLALHEASEA